MGGHRGLCEALRELLRSRAANVATFAALIAPVGLAVAALAVDAGALNEEKRRLQALADLAAITAAANPADAGETVLAVLRDNGVENPVLGAHASPLAAAAGADIVTVETGRYLADTARPSDGRFSSAATPANAVRVTIRREGKVFFAERLRTRPVIGVAAVAAAPARASFSIGSRLVGLDGGILNSVLGALTGGEIELSVMDYEALLSADVGLFPMLDALALDLGLEAGTYDDVLRAETTIGQVARAIEAAGGGSLAERNAVARLRGDLDGSDASLTLGSAIDLGRIGGLAIGSGNAALSATANVMELVTTSAMVANGEHQVALDLGVALPGLGGVEAVLTIGERPQHSPWLGIGETGTVVRTAQTRLAIDLRIGGSGILSGAAIRLPIWLDLATGEAALEEIACGVDGRTVSRVTIGARPGVADLRIAELASGDPGDLSREPAWKAARLVNLPLIRVGGAAHAAVGNLQSTGLSFSAAEIGNGTVKSVSTRDAVTSLAASLIGELDLSITVLGIGIGLPDLVRGALASALTAATPAIDQLLFNLLAIAGVRIGEADVRVTGAACGRSVLVQ